MCLPLPKNHSTDATWAQQPTVRMPALYWQYQAVIASLQSEREKEIFL